jgi:non-specific serine/threonine protein kinase
MVDQNSNNQDNDFEEALRQFVDANWRGQKPDIDEFVKKYPEFEHQIRQKVQSFKKIDALFDSLIQADESDFDDIEAEKNLVGEKINSFDIVGVIGRGGMGVVYLARDTRLNRSVALKSIPAQIKNNSTAQMRFKREAELLASLNHPNIAVIYEIIEQNDAAGYLILEYIPGETLSERIKREPLKLEEALSIARQIAEAVSAAHEKGVIHRDIKPSNIKLTPKGRVKVLDFGLAKSSVGEGKDIEITSTEPGHIIGTPAYMSPEQARGKDTDHRTDIWSFGCILYHMLTGHLPFEGQTATDTLAQIIERQPDWQNLSQKIPENIRILLKRCLEKDPERRLGDITDAVTEINYTLDKSSSVALRSKPSISQKVAMIIGVVTVGIMLSVISLKFIQRNEIQPSPKEIRLVVLPFENLSPADDEWFADGMTDEITSRLAGIPGLGVISRQSAMQYKNIKKGAQQIAKELNVDYILEGTIQRERPWDPNNRIRIRTQLIKATEDIHVWTQTYDKNMREIFQLQSDVAEQVAQGLDITLLGPERKILASIPTENLEAWEYYLRGNEYYHRGGLESDLRIAIQMYEKAVELDPTFTLAYAQLSRCHLRVYWFRDRSDEWLTKAKQAVNKSFELNPDLPEVHLAMGQYYYHGHLDYDRALEQFAIARKRQPNNGELLSYIGYVLRRQGKLEEALANQQKASELNPLSIDIAGQIGLTYLLLREHPQAERWYERVTLLAPDDPRGYYGKAWTYIRWQGSTQKARAVLEEGLKHIKSKNNTDFVNSLIYFDLYDGYYQKALDRLSLKPGDISDASYFIPIALRYALIYKYMNKNELANKYYEEARSILEPKILEQPDDARLHSSLGITYAGLGRKEDAIRAGKLAVELLPVTKDLMGGLSKITDLARIYVMVGELDASIDQLEFLLSKPGAMTVPILLCDPVWIPLRDHPHFKKLIDSYK